MKTLTLLRHAKSGWDDPVSRDFDRPLNLRGRKAAQTIGREMRAQGLRFDQVIASPATRVVETLGEVAAGYGKSLDQSYDQRLYLASTDVLLDVIGGIDLAVESLLLVGHNPGLEKLALLLTEESDLRREVEIKYPTATIAEIQLPVQTWKEVSERTGKLTRFIRPRDIDPELGPDEDSY